MTFTPHGRTEWRDVIVTRALPVTVEEAWAWVTDPERTARWVGEWSGEGRAGGVIEVQMTRPKHDVPARVRVDQCSAPTRLRLVLLDEPPMDWRVELSFLAIEDGCAVTLRHVIVPKALALGEVAAGWELHLERLAATVEGRCAASFREILAAVGPAYESASDA